MAEGLEAGAVEPAGSLRARALRGSIWTAVGFGTGQLIRLGSNLVLTRLLFPEAFGLMALVTAFLMGLEMLSDTGLAPSVVQSSRGDDPEFLDTAWTAQIARGFMLWGVVCLLAWPVARFYDQPELAGLLPVAALSVLLSGFNSTSLLLLRRHVNVRKLVLVDLAAQLASVVVMVSWVIVHPTVWALAVGGVVASGLRVVLSHTVVSTRRQHLAWDRGAARELLGFGKWIFASTALAFVASQSDRLVFGKLIPLSMLGAYSIAAMYAMLPTQILSRIGTTVLFPAISRSLAARSDVQGVYQQTRFRVLALGGVCCACAVATGRVAIETLYDPRYTDAGWIVQLLAARAWLQIVQIPSGTALLALGSPRSLARANMARLVGILLFVSLGYQLAGFSGALLGLAASELLGHAACVVGARRFGLRAIGAELATTVCFAAAGSLGAWVAVAMAGMGGNGTVASGIARLAVAAAVASAAWAPVAWVLLRAEWPRRPWKTGKTTPNPSDRLGDPRMKHDLPR